MTPPVRRFPPSLRGRKRRSGIPPSLRGRKRPTRIPKKSKSQ
jgi:hypothetical protein